MSRESSKPKLFFFADTYPYGKGEKSFVEPEIEALKKVFDITIVSHASAEAVADEENESILPDDVALIHIEPPSKQRKIRAVLGFPLSKIAFREVRSLIEDGLSSKRIREVLQRFSVALSLNKMYSQCGIFDDVDNAVFYTFWFDKMSLALALEKEKRPSLHIASRIHGYDLYNERNANNRQPFQRIMRDSMLRLIFLSNPAREYFVQKFGNESFPGQYVVNALGVGSRGTQPQKVDGSSFRLVSCSNVIPLKRVEMICRALGTLKHKNIEWVHFGDGEMLSGIKQLAEDLGVKLVSYGHVRNEVVLRYYNENYIDVFITTSSTEGSPVSIQEALSFGIPIIGTDVGAIRDQIDGNGILLSANPHIDEVATAISNLYEKAPDMMNEMRKRSKALWMEKFDSKHNKKLLTEELLGLSREEE